MERHRNKVDKDFHSKAVFVAHLRAFTEIPYARQILALLHPEDVYKEYPEVVTDRFVSDAPRFEARSRGLTRLVELRGADHVVELGAGYSPRGLAITGRESVHYLETDLEPNIREKERIVNQILKSEQLIRTNLRFEPLDVLSGRDWRVIDEFGTGPVTILNEGLLPHFDRQEVNQIVASVAAILRVRGGNWLTSDLVTKFERSRMKKDVLKTFSGKREAASSIEENAFDDEEQIRDVLDAAGLKGEAIHQHELVEQLVSVEKLGLPEGAAEEALNCRKIYCVTSQ